MKPVYELLASYGLTPAGYRARLESWSEEQTIDFLVTMCEAMLDSHDRQGARYSFIANGPMGGDSTRCSDPECRLTRIDETARFAALYADRVLILDPFEQFFGTTEVTRRLINEISVSIELLHAIRPAAEAGLIGMATGNYCFCKDHYRDFEAHQSDIETACTVLQDQYRDQLSVELRRSTAVENAWEFVITGPESLVEHGQFFYIIPKLPEELKARLDSDDRYVLSKDDVFDFGFPHRLTQPIVNDLLLQNLYATQGFHYLTDREIDFEVVSAVNDPETTDKSHAMLAGLSHSVPLIPDADLSALVKLRANEGEAFRVYRDKLNGVLGELQSESSLTESRVKQALQDAIEPELNKMDQVVRENKRLLVGQLRQDVVFGAGMVSVGLFSGLLPTNVGQVFAGLGGFRFVTSLLEKANSLAKEPSDVRKNSCYFLWKAMGGKKRSRQKSA